jgi:hypothetical protein
MLRHRSSYFVPRFSHVYSWNLRRKFGTIVSATAFTFITAAASSTITPASQQLAERFDFHNTVLLAVTTSVFVLANG